MLGEAHHDGSTLYVPHQTPDLGDSVDVFVRVPRTQRLERLHVRTTPDGEPRFVEARVDRSDEHEVWWRAAITVANPDTNYRFLLDRGSHGYSWLSATGQHDRDVPDDRDFRLTTFADSPEWAAEAVVYQIFPDRFASSGQDHRLPDWAVAADWYDDPVIGQGPGAGAQIYGGDLAGIAQHLDHIEALGANTVYLTPFFPATSNHRYDATDFTRVDPLLGGDQALIDLSRRLHERGMRLIGDLTTNHCGYRHAWFDTARSDPQSDEAGFFYWRSQEPGYLGWCEVPSLPKLNWRSAELRKRMIEAPDAVARRWLQPPYELDGWRIDVANMTARHAADDRNHEIARRLRRAVTAARPDALLIAEHGHDFTRDVTGDGWHGSMNYAGFLRPIWRWLADPTNTLDFLGVPVSVRPSPGRQVVDAMTDFLGAVPWRVRTANLNQLGSHDTPRIRTVTNDRALVEVGAALLLTMPGIPAIFAGDEIGLEGTNGEDSRRPIPWDRRERWDEALLSTIRALGWLRRRSPALQRGGLRWVSVDDDRVAFLRETETERVLVVAARAGGPAMPLSPAVMGPTGRIDVLHGAEPRVDRAGRIEVPGDGPAAHVWRLE